MQIHNEPETIAGVATPPGNAGIALIRISGPKSLKIAQNIFDTSRTEFFTRPSPNFLYYGKILAEGKTVDEVLLSYFASPRSFTTEDTVEINCHGGYFVVEKILRLILDCGARLAEPGEFTRRAFVNGRIDLSQVEAIDGLIHAKSPLAAEVSANNLKGALFQQIQKLREQVSWCLALINAEIDFSDENQSFIENPELHQKTKKILDSLQKLADRADQGIYLTEGFCITLVGRTNVGKSSVMNALLEKEKAIVTPIAGTTRDLIEDTFLYKNIPIQIIDTAGIRNTQDPIEQEGIRRSRGAGEKADLILWVVDQTDPKWEDREEFSEGKENVLVVLNKQDLAEKNKSEVSVPQKFPPYIRISAHSETDILCLKEKIFQFILGENFRGKITESLLITNLRQKECVRRALDQIQSVRQGLKEGQTEEIIGFELGELLVSLGEIVGEMTPDDLLDQVFSNFCIGK